tara:strand:+ start:1976 stop:2419 length:444 start_codon:yes stop_codon:yes gene_type:complete
MYKLSKRSKSKLEGVDERLVKVVKRAIEITKQDFSVICGLRTIEEQRRLLAEGRTQTLKSNHLTGLAVDLAAYDKGISWSLEDYYEIAEAIRTAAKELNVRVRWGAYWLAPLNSTTAPAEELVAIYIDTRRAQKRKPFLDAVHFELF